MGSTWYFEGVSTLESNLDTDKTDPYRSIVPIVLSSLKVLIEQITSRTSVLS